VKWRQFATELFFVCFSFQQQTDKRISLPAWQQTRTKCRPFVTITQPADDTDSILLLVNEVKAIKTNCLAILRPLCHVAFVAFTIIQTDLWFLRRKALCITRLLGNNVLIQFRLGPGVAVGNLRRSSMFHAFLCPLHGWEEKGNVFNFIPTLYFTLSTSAVSLSP